MAYYIQRRPLASTGVASMGGLNTGVVVWQHERSVHKESLGHGLNCYSLYVKN